MPWFKVDDTLHSHPKVRRAGLPALGLWAAAGAYCMAYKTDGFVPEWYVIQWPQGRKHATALVDAKFWHASSKDDETGWQFHDWSHYQPSAADIEADREHARDRQRKRRTRLRESRAEDVA